MTTQPGIGPFLWSGEGGLASASIYDNYGDEFCRF